MTQPLTGHATKEATQAWAERAVEQGVPAASFRAWQGLTLSSIGMGTYLGDADEATDLLVEKAVEEVLAGGINVIDTAINYRHQRAERSIGKALQRLAAEGKIQREALFISTKGGFIPMDGERPADPSGYLQERFLGKGLCDTSDIAAGCHCMTPDYLEDQLRTSLENLQLECVDLYHLHNPETQLGDIPRDAFAERLLQAFTRLEKMADEGLLQCYGAATWNGFRVADDEGDHLELSHMLDIARQAGGENHRFRAVQAPLNMMMPEALLAPSQGPDTAQETLLKAAQREGLYVQTSGSILQGQLARIPNPGADAAFPGFETAAQRALQFTRSAPGVTTALIGLKQDEHIRQALEVLAAEPAPGSIYSRNEESP